MKSNTYRIIYSNNGIDYRFNTAAFKAELNKRKLLSDEQKITYQEMYDQLSNVLNVSPEAVKRWRQGYNGPSDINLVKKIAEYFMIDYMVLLSDINGGDNSMEEKEISNIHSTESLDVIREVCGNLCEVVSYYNNTEGFGDYSTDNNSMEECDRLFNMLDQIERQINKNAWYILEVQYNKLYRLLNEVRFFVNYPSHVIVRWKKIEPLYYTICIYDEYATDDIDIFIQDIIKGNFEYDEIDSKKLCDELQEYSNGHMAFEPAYQVVGYRVTAWFMRIVRADFPECFISGEED